MRCRWLSLCAVVLLGLSSSTSASLWPFGDDSKASLIDIVKAGECAQVPRAKSRKLNLEERDGEGNTALIWAAYMGRLPCVVSLLAAGADVEGANTEGNRPSHVASFSGHTQVMDVLLSAGADIEARNLNDDTPLIAAAFFGQQASVQMLLGAGADANVANVDGRSPQELAHLQNHPNIALILSQHLKSQSMAQFSSEPAHKWSENTVQLWLREQGFPAAGLAALTQALGAIGTDGETMLLLREDHFAPPKCEWAGLCSVPFPTVLKFLARVKALRDVQPEAANTPRPKTKKPSSIGGVSPPTSSGTAPTPPPAPTPQALYQVDDNAEQMEVQLNSLSTSFSSGVVEPEEDVAGTAQLEEQKRQGGRGGEDHDDDDEEEEDGDEDEDEDDEEGYDGEDDDDEDDSEDFPPSMIL